MRITAKGIYAIRAIFDLAHHSSGTPVSLTSISKRQNISLPFLAQIFHLLRKGNIVKSVRGPKGGFILAKRCEDICIGEVLRIVEEPLCTVAPTISGEVRKKKRADECISNLLWRRLGEQIVRLLDSTSIADLLKETECPEICTFIPYLEPKGIRKR
ncbi:MAG: Rrf2 family transcriptional regulator [Acidobacteriota bacterium]